MRPRSLVILFAVVAVLGAFIWFFERDLPSTDERAQLAKRVLLLEPEEIRSFAIDSGDSGKNGDRTTSTTRTIRFGRSIPGPDVDPPDSSDLSGSSGSSGFSNNADDGNNTDSNPGKWRLTEPLAGRADDDAVSALLFSLTALEKERTLEDVDFAGLGLESPRLRILLDTQEQEWVLQVGEDVPASSQVVVALAGETEAYVVSNSFLSQLEKGAGEWRSREAFAGSGDDITSVSWSGSEGEIRLVRTGGGFRLETPVEDEANENKALDLIGAIADLAIEKFVESPAGLSALGLEPAVLEVMVGVKSQESPMVLKIGTRREDDPSVRFFSFDDQVFEAKTELTSFVGLDSEAGVLDIGSDSAASVTGWQSPEWSRSKVFEIDSVELTRGGEAMLLERRSGDWFRGEEKIPHSVATDLLYAMTGATSARVMAADPASRLGEPTLEMRIVAGELEEQLILYAEQEDGYPARRVGREYSLMLSAESGGELLKKVEAVRSAEPVLEEGLEGEEGF